jgi:hypothetical protein
MTNQTEQRTGEKPRAIKYSNETAVQARALELAGKWGIRCSLDDPLSIEIARAKVKQKLLGMAGCTEFPDSEDITAAAYLLVRVDSFSPDSQLYRHS